MTAEEFKAQERAKSVERFGRWASTTRRDSADQIKIIMEHGPKNELEAQQHGNALANTGNYPVGTSECFNVGISGGCGPDCFVYLKGECGCPEEMLSRLEGAELKAHYDIYGLDTAG